MITAEEKEKVTENQPHPATTSVVFALPAGDHQFEKHRSLWIIFIEKGDKCPFEISHYHCYFCYFSYQLGLEWFSAWHAEVSIMRKMPIMEKIWEQ